MTASRERAPATPPASDPTGAGLGWASLWRPLLEWGIWTAIAVAVYLQTGVFDREIQEYRFGPDGWPKALCIALFIGASGQLLYKISLLARGLDEGDEAEPEAEAEARKPLTAPRVLQRIAIFCFPLLYLYLVPTYGFYVMTPFFLVGMLLILEVKSPQALITVTAVIYVFFLLIFTRLFYVAVPVGQIEPFYSINNAIIAFARSGF